MNDAPERIWALPCSWLATKKSGAAEYVRADLYEAQKAKARAAHMKSMSDFDQASDAYDAQLKAEAEVKRLREALKFYADPVAAGAESVPDFYSELSFGDRAEEALKGDDE